MNIAFVDGVYEEHKIIKSGYNSFSINTAKLIAGTYILTISGKVNYLHKFLKTTK